MQGVRVTIDLQNDDTTDFIKTIHEDNGSLKLATLEPGRMTP